MQCATRSTSPGEGQRQKSEPIRGGSAAVGPTARSTGAAAPSAALLAWPVQLPHGPMEGILRILQHRRRHASLLHNTECISWVKPSASTTPLAPQSRPPLPGCSSRSAAVHARQHPGLDGGDSWAAQQRKCEMPGVPGFVLQGILQAGLLAPPLVAENRASPRA